MKYSEYLLVFIYLLKQLCTSYSSTVTSNFSSTNDAILRSIQQLNAKVEIIERNVGDILDIGMSYITLDIFPANVYQKIGFVRILKFGRFLCAHSNQDLMELAIIKSCRHNVTLF